MIITRIGKRRRQKELAYDVEDEEDVSYQTETIVEDEFEEFDEFDEFEICSPILVTMIWKQVLQTCEPNCCN